MATNLAAVIVKCPKAFNANRVFGSGAFALLSCDDGISRRVHLHETERQRIKSMDSWDDDRRNGCGVPNCKGEHILIDFPPALTEILEGSNGENPS